VSEIGGYFSLELSGGSEYHSSAVALNSARNAFEYVLEAKKYTKIHVPHFLCDSMLEPVLKLGVDIERYHINPLLEVDVPVLTGSEAFLYVNYFGIKNSFVLSLSQQSRNIVIDNSQSFFTKKHEGVDTIFSPRKFFGVPDGGYLYTDVKLDRDLPQDISADRFAHLLKRIEGGARHGYSDYLKCEKSLSEQPIRSMSALTRRILKSADYDYSRRVRNKNFCFLHEHLSSNNQLSGIIDIGAIDGPMVYPFLSENRRLKNKLLGKDVFVATYWPEVVDNPDSSEFERHLAQNLIAVPIDQRYSEDNLAHILSILGII